MCRRVSSRGQGACALLLCGTPGLLIRPPASQFVHFCHPTGPAPFVSLDVSPEFHLSRQRLRPLPQSRVGLSFSLAFAMRVFLNAPASAIFFTTLVNHHQYSLYSPLFRRPRFLLHKRFSSPFVSSRYYFFPHFLACWIKSIFLFITGGYPAVIQWTSIHFD